jgi:hypothetical protein
MYSCARQDGQEILSTLQLSSNSTGAGFIVAPTHRPCTKGLWMWNTPVERTNADGSKYHLVGNPSRLSYPTPSYKSSDSQLSNIACPENELISQK